MKKQLTTLFLMAAALLMPLSLTSCGEDVQLNENGRNNGKPKTETKFSSRPAGTRTSLSSTADANNKYPFYWETGDNIWVDENKNGTFTLTSSRLEIDASDKNLADFFFNNANLTEKTYDLVYTGNASTKADEVTIKNVQEQNGWNSSAHLGTSGDCGVATATQDAIGDYTFELNHKAAYLIIYPYMVSSIPTHYPLNRSYTLMKVEVKSSDGTEIAGTYNFGSTGITGTATSNASDLITLNCSTAGFPLENNDNPSKKHLFVVLRPTENQELTLTYHVKDDTYSNVFTYSLSLGSRTYNPGGVTVITHQIPDLAFNMPSYYKWGAVNPYPAVQDDVTRAPNPRIGGVWNDLPTVNELVWYAQTAMPTVNIRWRINGQSAVYTCGIWMKKRQYISGFNANSTSTGGDWRTASNQQNLIDTDGDIYRRDNPALGNPSSDVINQYFFLPCFGLYHVNAPNVLTNFGTSAYYWQRTAGPNGFNAVRFGASSATVNINLQQLGHGMVAGSGWWQ